MRPAVVLADAGRDDYILCQITSKPYGDPRAIRIDASQIAGGALRVTSFARQGKIFTANVEIIEAQVATLVDTAIQQVIEAVVELVRTGR